MPELDPTRFLRFTASLAPKLMQGDRDDLQQLFLRATGDPRYQRDPFDGSWLARYGMAIEPIALDYHAEKTGVDYVDRGVQVFHPTRDFVSATLDARKMPGNVVTNVKCIVDPRKTIDDALAYYTPQLIVEQECAQADDAALLVVKGGGEPQEVAVYIDEDYRALVWRSIDRFWHCVETLTPPVPLYFPRVVPPEKWRTIDLDNDEQAPNWCETMRQLLNEWSVTEPQARAHEAIKVEIKSIFPDDCGRLLAGPFTVVRARNNAVSIKLRKDRAA
jgi:hypothetical protein